MFENEKEKARKQSCSHQWINSLLPCQSKMRHSVRKACRACVNGYWHISDNLFNVWCWQKWCTWAQENRHKEMFGNMHPIDAIFWTSQTVLNSSHLGMLVCLFEQAIEARYKKWSRIAVWKWTNDCVRVSGTRQADTEFAAESCIHKLTEMRRKRRKGKMTITI